VDAHGTAGTTFIDELHLARQHLPEFVLAASAGYGTVPLLGLAVAEQRASLPLDFALARSVGTGLHHDRDRAWRPRPQQQRTQEAKRFVDT
jgi:hypothetical protein